MRYLSDNWMIEPVFDYEYKSYQVMAFAKSMEQRFEEGKLYPYLAELKKHLDLIRSYEDNKAGLEESLHRELINIDLKALELVRKELPDKDGVVGIINEILSFARSKFQEGYRDGLDKKKILSRQIQLTPIGIVNPQSPGGLLLLSNPGALRIYSYRTRLVRRPESEQAYKDICTAFIDEVKTGLLPDYSSIKWRYINKTSGDREITTYLVEAEMEIPRFESLMPLVKERLLTIDQD